MPRGRLKVVCAHIIMLSGCPKRARQGIGRPHKRPVKREERKNKSAPNHCAVTYYVLYACGECAILRV